MQLRQPHPALLQPLSGAPQLTDFRGLLDSVVRDAVTGLRQLSSDLPASNDGERWAMVASPGGIGRDLAGVNQSKINCWRGTDARIGA